MQEVRLNRSVGERERSFFLIMSIVISIVVVYGFSHTIGDNLIHPAYPRPLILYAHAFISFTWVLLFIVQTSLVRMHRVDLHRRLGQWGLVHGSLIIVLGIPTAIAMAQLRLAHGDPDAAVSFPIPVNDMLAFTAMFVLAALWRKRPEFHRRLMFMATCILTAAAFGRIPILDHAEWFYTGVDALILIGALRDLAVTGSIHPVYRYGLPGVILGQLVTAYFRWTPTWLAMAPQLFGKH